MLSFTAKPLKKINKTYKALARLTKQKGDKTQIQVSGIKENITKYPTAI